MKGSWRTTTLGILTIVIAVCTGLKALIDGDPTTNVDIPVLATAITSGFGLIKARDDKVTSETAGAK